MSPLAGNPVVDYNKRLKYFEELGRGKYCTIFVITTLKVVWL